MMLNADIRNGGGGLVKCGHLRTGGYENGSFLRTSFMDDPQGRRCIHKGERWIYHLIYFSRNETNLSMKSGLIQNAMDHEHMRQKPFKTYDII